MKPRRWPVIAAALIPVSSGVPPVRAMNALRMSGGAGRRRRRRRHRPPPAPGLDAARRRHRRAVTSSSRCVAHSTATPRSRTSPRTWRTIADLDATSSPTVGSSSTSTRGSMQQRARDLDPPHLPARQFPHLVARAIGQVDVGQHVLRAPARLAPADAVQRRVVQQVVHHRDIEIERARLEHHAQLAQRLARLARHAMAEHARSSPACVS